MSCRTRLWLSRLHAALLALLLVGQIPPVRQGGPAALPAWQLAAVCHAGDDGRAPAMPADQHHDHCAMCLAMAAPLLPPDAISLPTPVGAALAEAVAAAHPAPRLYTHRPYAPRAPPMIA